MMKIAISVKSPDIRVDASILPCLAAHNTNRDSLYLISMNAEEGHFVSTCLRSDKPDFIGKSFQHVAADLENFIFLPAAATTLSNGDQPSVSHG